MSLIKSDIKKIFFQFSLVVVLVHIRFYKPVLQLFLTKWDECGILCQNLFISFKIFSAAYYEIYKMSNANYMETDIEWGKSS